MLSGILPIMTHHSVWHGLISGFVRNKISNLHDILYKTKDKSKRFWPVSKPLIYVWTQRRRAWRQGRHLDRQVSASSVERDACWERLIDFWSLSRTGSIWQILRCSPFIWNHFHNSAGTRTDSSILTETQWCSSHVYAHTPPVQKQRCLYTLTKLTLNGALTLNEIVK